MNVNLVLLEDDKLYSRRFVEVFGELFPQTEILSFSDFEKAETALGMRTADILLVSENIYNSNADALYKLGCKVVIILTNNKNAVKIDEYDAVCKYQRADNLNQVIMKTYSEVANVVVKSSGSSSTKVYTFISGAGGTGCSAAAAAYSQYLASRKKKVLYLDMSSLGTVENYFNDEGNYSMTDCLIAVINRSKNFEAQLNNFVRHDKSGVYYYASCENALDWTEVTSENKKIMLETLIDNGYQAIVVDMPPEWNEVTEFLTDYSDAVYIVTNGTVSANSKASKLSVAAETYCKTQKKDSSKLGIVYNCFGRNSSRIQSTNIKVYAELPYMSSYNNTEILARQLSARNYWE